MSLIKVICMSSDRTAGMVPGFIHQWQRYGAFPVTIVCQQKLPDTLPATWSLFRSANDSEDCNWTGHLMAAVHHLSGQDDLILLVMDDYWLCQGINDTSLFHAWKDMEENEDIQKIDLSGDRLGFAHTEYNSQYARSKNDAEYLTSTQAALWRRRFLLDCLYDPAWTPWQFELDGTARISGNDLFILGQKQPCIQYANVSLRGQKALRLDRLKADDIDELKAIGAL